MQSWIRRLITPPVFEGDEDKTRTARVLHRVLLTIIVVALLSVLVTPFVPRASDVAVIVPPLVILASVGLALVQSGRLQLASWLSLSGLWVFITALISFSGGVDNIVPIAYIVIVIGAGLLVGSRATTVFTGLGVAAVAGMSYMGANNLLPPRLYFNSAPGKFAWLAGCLVLAGAYLSLAIRNLTEALERARQSNRELQTIRASLEERVEERTRDLAQRAHYLEATAAVAHDAASVLNLEELLGRVAALVSQQFGFYHTGIFLLDSAQEWAVLQAASSEGGKRMLERGHRLQVGGQSIVGYATRWGEPRIALDVGADAVFFNNPDLPATRSEMALPLRARDQIIGALDVQSTLPRAFSQEDIATLQILADQVAMAINNAQLFQQAQEGLEAERRAYGELGREAWLNLLRARPDLGYRYERQKVVPVGEIAAETRPPDEKLPELTLPVKYRGQTLGAIVAHKGADAKEWTSEEIALMETLTDQLSAALESARLYQDTQRRAAREQLTGAIAARMRETLDVETVLKTALREMHDRLGLAEAEVAIEVDGASD